MSVLYRANDALSVNPPIGVDSALSLTGSDWLWAVTAIYVVAFLGLLGFCFTAHESNRVFHYLFTIALLVGSVTYYAQASDLGWSAVSDGPGSRSLHQLFYARYINWVVSFPSVALALGLLSGISWTTIFTNIAITWLWVLTYLAAAYTPTSYKWGFFAFGTLAYVFLAMSTLNESREAAGRLGISRDYVVLAAWANLLWLLYPIAFGVSDGSGIISVTGGSIFFGVLDVLMVPVLSFGFVFLGRKWDWARLHLAVSEYRFDPHARTLSDKQARSPAEGDVPTA
ncbi:hypothetical protein GGR54DRAFT_173854 [Hypoxylon sp. NC1633]|nr:hypothetical protein GGR54DRAFT_173854 [Hypoxylon sp. NC1633]